MITRNEAKNLPRLAESVLPIIDSWCIVDNGSTDDTEDVVLQLFGHLPGSFHHSKLDEFCFDTARNEMLDLASEPGVYLLLMDPDDPLVGTIDKDALTAPAYFIPTVCGGSEWKMPVLVQSDLGARYVGRVHEYLKLPPGTEPAFLDTCAIARTGFGADLDRMLWYVDVLAEDAKADPRAAFFLANTYRDLLTVQGDEHWRQKAIDAYVARAKMPSDQEEETYLTILRCADLYEDIDPQRAYAVFMEAAGFRPMRPEAWGRLAKIANALDEHHAAMAFAEKGLNLPKTTDWLFVERWWENWGLRFEAAVAGWWLGEKDAAYGVFEALLTRKDLSAAHRQLAEHNLSLRDNPNAPITHAIAMRAVQGLGEGTISQVQAEWLGSLVAGRGPMKIAETGFGIGWSAWAFLAANPETTVVSFDIGEHAAVHQAKAVIDKHFPGRHTLIVGNSTETVPAYLATHANDFDLVFIDGGHDYVSASSDLANFASPGRIVAFDDLVGMDWAVGGVKAWDEATSPDGFVEQDEVFNDGGIHRWAIGRYVTAKR